jgi:hopanoid biosynthesis associated RND transporter like protein HpnN
MDRELEVQNRQGVTLASLITFWTKGITRFAPWVVLAWILAAIGALLFTVAHLRLDADIDHMISAELPVRKTLEEYRKQFPEHKDQLVLVIEGDTPERVDQATARLATQLKQQMEQQNALFGSVYQPGSGPFFEQQGLLFLSLKELQGLTDDLAQAQPIISQLAADPTLHGLFTTLTSAIENRDKAATVDLSPLLARVNDVLGAILAGHHASLSWAALMHGKEKESTPYRRFILVQPSPDYSALFPIAPALDKLRALAKEAGIDQQHGVRLRITGNLALEHEEMQAVTEGASIAGVLAILLVTATLFVGLGSVRMILASLFTLIAGLLVTAAFATGAIGHLNMISVAFAVLNIGLGIDFSVHFCMRYREAGLRGEPARRALFTTFKDIAPSLLWCAITTAVGFYSFIPTPYSGVAELGLIAGTGMFISLLASLTLLPALLHLWRPAQVARYRFPLKLPSALVELPVRQHKVVLACALALAVGSGLLIPSARFDYSPLNLRPASAESVATFKDLLADRDHTPLRGVVMARDLQQLQSYVKQLRALPVVDEVLTLKSFVADQQQEKLAYIEELNLILGPDLQLAPQTQTPVSFEQQRGAIKDLISALEQQLARGTLSPTGVAPALRDHLRTLLQRLEAAGEDRRMRYLKELQDALVGTLSPTLEQLAKGLDAEPYDVNDLPSDLVDRWLSDDGTYRIEVLPAEDITNPEALRNFVSAIQRVAPNDVTGEPVQMLVVGDTIIKSFKHALGLAFVVISVLVLFGLRSLRGAGLVIMPLLFGAMLTVATLVLFGIPFNFANVIALPLLLGIGVDNGIHLVRRLHGRTGFSPRSVLYSSTTRAMVFSALTTIASFGNLSFSGHPGMASLGLVLVVGVLAMLLSTLVLVPALSQSGFLQRRIAVR